MRLKDKVALITGASSGIGRAIATRFVVEGAHVDYRPGSEVDNEAAQGEAASFGPSSIAVVVDVSKWEDVERMMAEIIKEFGRIDIAINNAGIETRGIVNLTRILRIAPFHVVVCALLSATDGGHLVGSSLKLTIPVEWCVPQNSLWTKPLRGKQCMVLVFLQAHLF